MALGAKGCRHKLHFIVMYFLIYFAQFKEHGFDPPPRDGYHVETLSLQARLFSAFYWCVVGSVASSWVFSQDLGFLWVFSWRPWAFLGSFNVTETTFFPVVSTAISIKLLNLLKLL